MAVSRMSIPQYEAFRKAQKEGNYEKAQEIVDMGYVKEFDETDLNASEAEIIEEAYTEENILDDVAAGLDNKEICEKYGISPQKLGSIKKGAK